MRYLIIIFLTFVVCIGIGFTETPSVKTKPGQQAETTISSFVFKCDGYPSKTPGHVDSEKPKEEPEKSKEGKREYKPRYLVWSCPHQKSVEKPFNELYIPIKSELGQTGDIKVTAPSLKEIEKLNQTISATASKTINKNCSCNITYENKYTKNPVITCQCSGTYKEPKPTDPR